MAESNSQATRCPCGFFGSAQTLGLCSKCYNEREHNRAQLAVDATRSTSTPPGGVGQLRGAVVDRESTAFQTDDSPSTPPLTFAHIASSNISISDSAGAAPIEADTRCCVEEQDISPTECRGASETCRELAGASRQRGTKRCKWDGENYKRAINHSSSPNQGANVLSLCENTEINRFDDRKRKFDAIDDAQPSKNHPSAECPLSTSGEDRVSSMGGSEGQKNKKRCHSCNCRLQPAVREIGKCKCDNVFCALHRLPEQHVCTFDHKTHGRDEALAKMVAFRKNIGTSLKRLDPSDS